MQQVFIAQNPPEAHLIKGLLESYGIAALIQGEDLFGIRGGIPITTATCPSVWVAAANLEQARELIADFLQEAHAERTQGEKWHCPGCGEILEAQFTDCWNCGTGRSVVPPDECAE